VCLAIPARIVAIDEQEAEVDVGGVRRQVSLLFTPQATVGDYVQVHTGFALSLIDPDAAAESLRILQSLRDAYSAEDLYLSAGSLPSDQEPPVV
jgi:hydrogenase expression/formation protein HypC